MFGYVKAYKPELRIKEYEMYKAIYCSICKQIGKKYGFVNRFSLSYDFVFLMLLYLSLRDGCLSAKQGKCVYNPFKKCNFLEDELPDFPLAAAQIMLYYKLLDNIEDEGFLKSLLYRVLKLFTKKGYKKAATDFPKLEIIFKDYYNSQSLLEKENIENIDKAADPTAKMLSELFAMCSPDGESRALERMGYCLGRWIYILDAVADLKEDVKHNKYNPLKKSLADLKTDNDALKQSLAFCATETAAAFELLDIRRFKNILGNIIYLGLENSLKEVIEKEKQK